MTLVLLFKFGIPSFPSLLSLLVSVRSPSHVWLFATPSTTAWQAFLSLRISQSLPKFMSNASVMPSSHLSLWCPPLFSQSFPVSGFFPMSHLFASGNQKSFSINPSNEYSGLSSLKIEWFDPLAVQGTLASHIFKVDACCYMSFPGGTSGKEPACQCRRCKKVQSPGWEVPKRGHGNPLQHSSLGNPMDRGAWQATVHRAAQRWTWLKQFSMQAHMLLYRLNHFKRF